MKKLLYSSIILLLFSFSVILVQVSCQKDATAEIENDSSVQNKFLYTVWGDTECQYWISNVDGTSHQLITISLPAGQSLDANCKLTPDAQKIIFCSEKAEAGTIKYFIYSANIDGSNVSLIRELSSMEVHLMDTF